MGIGRQVADAYISVHGDLSDFRKDLDKAGGYAAEQAAMRNADKFSDAWNKRITQDVNSKWGSVVDAMYSNQKIDWDKMIGAFDSKNLDDAQNKVSAFMKDMQAQGALTQEQYDSADKSIRGVLSSMRDQEEQMKKLHDAHTDAITENERWARSFDGIRKNDAITKLNADFGALAKSMGDADLAKFAKGFDTLNAARARIYEVTAAMEQQNRITREQSEQIHANINAFIDGENAKAKAMRDALNETNKATDAQNRYNNSLAGMARNFHFADLEGKFRQLAAAVDTNDFSAFGRGAKDAAELRDRITETAAEMHRLGRMSDQEFTLIGKRAQEVSAHMSSFNVELDHTATSLGNGSGNGIRFTKILGGLGDASRGLREHLQGFAGLNVFGDMIDGGLEFIHNLDRIALSASTTALKLGSMTSLAGSSLAGLAVIASDILGALGGISAALPAFLVGAGIGIGILVAAFKDMKTLLKDLGPQFTKLQDAVSAKFWSKAAGPIRAAVNELMPLITAKSVATADALGKVFGSLADSLKGIPKASIGAMFDHMNHAITILAGAMPHLVSAFTNLGTVGSKFFTRFSTWLVKLSGSFDAFIQKATDNGDLEKWISNGIEGFKNMGRAIDGTLGIFNAISDAARNAGSGGLKEFADKLQGIAAVMQGETFQKALTTFFEGANTGAKILGTELGKIGPAIAGFMPTLKGALIDIATAAGIGLKYIGEILENKAVKKGVNDFTSSLVNAMGKLAPAVKPFADSLGTTLSLLGKITISVAEVVAAFVINLGPVLDSMSAKMETLVAPLADAATKFISDLKGPLEAIDREIVGPMVAAFRDKLLPALTGPGGFSEKFSEFITKVITDVSPAFKAIVEDVLPNLIKLAGEVLGPLGKLVELLSPAFATTVGAIGTALGNMANDIKVLKGELPIETLSLFKNFSPEEVQKQIEKDKIKPQDWKDILGVFFTKNIGEGMALAWTEKIWPAIVKADDWLFEHILDGWDKLWSGRAFGDDFKTNWDNYFNGVQSNNMDLSKTVTDWMEGHVFKPMRELGATIGKLWDETIGAFWDTVFGGGGSEPVASGGSGGGAGGKGMGVTGKLDPAMLGLPDEANTRSWFETFGTWLSEGFNGAMAVLGESITTFSTDTKTNWDNFWNGIGTKVQEIWDGVVLWIQTKAAEIKLGIDTFIADTTTNWDNFWNGVNLKVQEIWNGVTTWIATKTAEIKTGLDTFIADTKTNWGNFWNGVKTKVEEIWNGVTSWIRTKVGEAKTSIDNFIRDTRTNWDNFWNGIGEKVRTGWADIGRNFETGVNTAVEWVRGLPQRALDALGNLGGWLTGQGEAMMNGFKQGLTNKFEEVKAFVGTIAQWIADHKGPISYDRKLLIPAGNAIMDGLGQGLRDKLGMLKGVLDTVTGTMEDAVTGAFAKSKMYLAGADAALGLAAGLKDNKGALTDVLGSMIPADGSLKLTGTGGVGGSTPGNTTIINVAEGAIPVTTPTKDPELVASKVIDGFANFSNF